MVVKRKTKSAEARSTAAADFIVAEGGGRGRALLAWSALQVGLNESGTKSQVAADLGLISSAFSVTRLTTVWAVPVCCWEDIFRIKRYAWLSESREEGGI